MENFRALSSASYRLKRKYEGCKSNIKYDDERMDLVLDFKTSDGSSWRRLHPWQAREMPTEEGRSEEMSTSDMTELLREGADEEEENDTFTGADE